MSVWAFENDHTSYTTNGTTSSSNAANKVVDDTFGATNSSIRVESSSSKTEYIVRSTYNDRKIQQIMTRQCLTTANRYEQQLVNNGVNSAQTVHIESSEFNYDSLGLNVPLHEDEELLIAENLGINVSSSNMPQTMEAAPSTSAEVVEGNDDVDDEEIDIQVRNVVCNYTLPLHIDLHRVALSSGNVSFDRGRGVLMKQKRNPSCYVKIYSSGKIYIVGCRSEVECKRAARGIARMVQKSMGRLGEVVRIRNYRVCNVLATCKMPFGIKIEELAQKYPGCSEYEPELSVGLIWRSTDPHATLRIHTTGSITVTGAASESDVMRAIEIIYPIVKKFRCDLRLRDGTAVKRRRPTRPAIPVVPFKRPRVPQPVVQEVQRFTGTSGAYGNRVYFSDEEDDEDDEFEDVV